MSFETTVASNHVFDEDDIRITPPPARDMLLEIMLEQGIESPYMIGAGKIQSALEISQGTLNNAYRNPTWNPQGKTLKNLTNLWLEMGIANHGFFPTEIEQYVFNHYRQEYIHAIKTKNENEKKAFLTRYRIRSIGHKEPKKLSKEEVSSDPTAALEYCAALWLAGHFSIDQIAIENPDVIQRKALAKQAVSYYAAVRGTIDILPDIIDGRNINEYGRREKILRLLEHDIHITDLLALEPKDVVEALDNKDEEILFLLSEADRQVDWMLVERPWNEDHLINKLEISSLLGHKLGCKYAYILFTRYFNSQYCENELENIIDTSSYLEYFLANVRQELPDLKCKKIRNEIICAHKAKLERTREAEKPSYVYEGDVIEAV